MGLEKDQPATPVVDQNEIVLKKLKLDKLPVKPAKNSKFKRFFQAHRKKILIGGGALLALILIVGGVLAFHGIKVANQLKAQASEAKITAQAAFTNFKNHIRL